MGGMISHHETPACSPLHLAGTPGTHAEVTHVATQAIVRQFDGKMVSSTNI